MMMEYFEQLEDGLRKAIASGQASPRKIYSLEVARLGKRLYSGTNRVAWCGITAPFDLLGAMGITSCFVEFIGAMLASTGAAGEFIEATEHIGYSSDSCSYHRAVTGAAIKGLMPEPEFLIGTTNPCSGGLAVIENLAAHFKKKLFVLHVPQDESGKNVRYFADQLRDMTAFITDVTGITPDPEKLKMAMTNTNRTRSILAEIYDLARGLPSPVTSKELSNFGIVMALFLGTEEAVNVAEAYRDEFKHRLAAGATGRPKEKFRLLWIQNRIQFKNPIEKLLEDEFGARIVIDELNDITWDPIDLDDIYGGLARRSISIPFNGTIEKRVSHLRKLAKAYQVDGAVNPCNWGCRQGTGARGLIEDGLKEIGVPVLNLEVDCVDSRKFTEGQFRTRLEAFVEMMESRK
ncbi:MAG: 2-hydroxyacyl-CoA dehydratase family protein [Thermodesulfobacteriota bacterium]